MAIGAFYENAGLGSISRNYYTEAIKSPRAVGDREARNRAQLALGLLLLKGNDPQGARKIFEKARKDCDPQQEAGLLLGLGRADFQMKNLKGARQVFEEILTRYPDTEQARVARENLEHIK